MNQQPPDIAVSTFGDPAETRRPAAAMLTWDQTQPRRHLPARLNIMPIPERRDEGRRTQRPNPLHLLQALARVQLVAEACELARNLNNPGIKRVQLTLQALQEGAHHEGYAVLCVFYHAGQALAEAGNPWGSTIP